ncbi:MAG: translation initiation factor IF-2, partial [Myxococcota bacterium]|nr:translation initiation factor IF-2 [Myxococcota bacterium]
RVRRSKGGKKKASPKPKALKRRIFIDSQITVGDLAHQMSVKSGEVIKKLISFDMMCTQNDTIDFDTAQMVAEMFEYEVIDNSTNEKDFLIKEETKEELEGDPRPSVVTIMGHVDHGKTTLLDTIRKANVASGEAGGITQHLSAYQVQKNGEKITFIDTPGHEAFTAMRSSGAQVTDIVVLVVAADDGVMPQTKEALSHAKAAGVDIIVAINKCDKPGANPEKVKQELMNLELIPEEYGGDTIFVEISALKGEGIDELLESILLTAEMGEYVAPADSHAQGTVLEARLDKGKGPVATVIIKQGKLKRGDSLVLGKVWGRVRAMTDYNGKKIKEALPSMPVEIIGLQETPIAGDDFTVVKNDKDARALVDLRIEEEKKKSASKPKKLTLEDLLMHQEQGEVLTLNLIVKTDVGGTLEAIRGSLEKINIEGTEIKVLHAAVGAITEGDIGLAHTYGGIVIGFNIRPDSKARKAINELSVDVKTYKVIYEAIEDIQKALKGLLSPEKEEVVQGLAEIREIFHTKFGTVAGSVVTEGKLNKKYGIRLLRNSIVIWDGKIGSLRRFKDNVREVEKGKDCGIILEGFNDIKPLDIIESYSFEDKAII